MVTPNIPEAEVLTGMQIDNGPSVERAARQIYDLGAKNVIIKGGHASGEESIDILFDGAGFHEFSAPRINTKNTHGTGCTLSSALATYLSQRKNIYNSCKMSLRYVDEAITYAPGYGKGFGPLNHLISFNLFLAPSIV